MQVPTQRLEPGVWWITPTLPVWVMDAVEPGSTVCIQAGIHGNEVAGVHALEELLESGLAPRKGRLILIPRMNPAACRARTRTAPGGQDLNRRYPGSVDGPSPEDRLAHALFQLVLIERPELVATLHESHKRYSPNVTPSFGQTLVYGVDACPPVLQQVVTHLNDHLGDPEERWESLHYPVATSSTEQIVNAIGCVGTCVETWMGFGERRRIDMHKQVVRLLLDAYDVFPLSEELE
jgi:hypothetical protein